MKEAFESGFPLLAFLFVMSFTATLVHLTKSGVAYRKRRVKFPWAYWLCAAGTAAEAIYCGGQLLEDFTRQLRLEGLPLAYKLANLIAPVVSLHGALLFYNASILGLILNAPRIHLRTGYRPAVIEIVLRSGGASPREIAGKLGGVLKELGYALENPRPWKCEAVGILWRAGHQGVKLPVMVFATLDPRERDPVLRITVDVMDLILNDDKETRWTVEMALAIMEKLKEPAFAPHILAMTLGRTPKPVV